jgi:hypothetical protein
MLFLLATLAAAGAAPTVVRTPEPAAAAQRCAPPKVTYAQQMRRNNRVHRLGEEPPATQYLAVSRHVGGCPDPAIVRTGIGR